MASLNNELITLNVGGKLFHTTRTTLTKHPDSMLAAMFRGGMQATALRDEAGHPFLDRDPALFPFILAYLRDGRVPQGLLELRQLQVEAEFFAMAELAAAVAEAVAANESAAEKAAAAAAFQQKHATDLRRLDASRAAAIDAAEDAVRDAWDAVADAGLRPLAGRYQDAANQLQEAQQLWEHVQALPPEGRGREVWDDEMRAALQEGLEEAQAEMEAMRNNPAARAAAKAEAAADKQLRTALLARLCALGADLPAAEAQLRATHPDLADRTFEE